MFMSCLVHMSISDFLVFVKNGFVVRVRSLKVTAQPLHSNNAAQAMNTPHCVSATSRLVLDNRPIQFNSPNTYTHGVH